MSRIRSEFTLAAVSVAVGTLQRMGEPFIGSEAVAAGALTPYALRSKFVALYPDVYVPRGAGVTAGERARAAWLWSGRRGVVAGQSAAALHGAKWVDADRPAELLWPNRHPPRGIHTWSDQWADDEVEVTDLIRLSTPARTALDLACHYPLGPLLEQLGRDHRRFAVITEHYNSCRGQPACDLEEIPRAFVDPRAGRHVGAGVRSGRQGDGCRCRAARGHRADVPGGGFTCHMRGLDEVTHGNQRQSGQAHGTCRRGRSIVL